MSEQFKSIETTELIKIANAIRVKTGNNEQIALKDMPDKIRSIEGGGIYLPELEFEGSSADLLAGKQLIDSEGNIVTGTIPTTAQATPTISVNSTGKITATASQSAGYVEAGTKTATHQLDAQAAQTITPSTSDKTIAAGKYLTGTQTIKGDANLKAENIAEGVSIFGVAGTHAGDSGGVILPTLTNAGTASDLLSGKQLIDGDGNIVEGTITTKTESNLTVNGATVTVPSGYYATQATKSVATATQATPSIDVDSSGLITASATQTSGYVSGGTKSATKWLTTQGAKSITPTTSSQTAVASGVYTTGDITVEAIPSEYTITSDATATAADILSGETAYVNGEKVTGTIVTKTSDDLTASGATVTVPAGYYTNDTTKSVSTATQATPSITVNSSGLITATATQTAGYVAAGTKSATKQLAFQAAKTITPTTASQIAVSSGYYTGGDVTVAAIPSTYIKPSYTKAATTYTPKTTNQTISAGTYCSGVQTIKGDSNLVAGNIRSGVSIFGVSGSYEGEGGGNTNAEDSLVMRTVTTYTNDRVASIGSYAFNYCSSLTSVSFPAATTIGSYAFAYCSGLTSVSFPAATTINYCAFACCYSLTSVSFPAARTIGNYAFDRCSSLTSVSFPAATTISSQAFAQCYSLTSVSFPAARTIGRSAFQRCSSLTTLYLTGSSLCSLAASTAFTSTGIGSNKGYIYVPSSLVASYKAATNWAFFSNRIYSYLG